MGRGRSKAKQTKVARDLKYSNQDMDLESLAKELHGESTVTSKNNLDSDSNSDDNYPRWDAAVQKLNKPRLLEILSIQIKIWI